MGFEYSMIDNYKLDEFLVINDLQLEINQLDPTFLILGVFTNITIKIQKLIKKMLLLTERKKGNWKQKNITLNRKKEKKKKTLTIILLLRERKK